MKDCLENTKNTLNSGHNSLIPQGKSATYNNMTVNRESAHSYVESRSGLPQESTFPVAISSLLERDVYSATPAQVKNYVKVTRDNFHSQCHDLPAFSLIDQDIPDAGIQSKSSTPDSQQENTLNIDPAIQRKLFKCSDGECSKRFNTDLGLRIHTGKMHSKWASNFSCKICPESFTTQNYCDKHILTAHPKEECSYRVSFEINPSDDSNNSDPGCSANENSASPKTIIKKMASSKCIIINQDWETKRTKYSAQSTPPKPATLKMMEFRCPSILNKSTTTQNPKEVARELMRYFTPIPSVQPRLYDNKSTERWIFPATTTATKKQPLPKSQIVKLVISDNGESTSTSKTKIISCSWTPLEGEDTFGCLKCCKAFSGTEIKAHTRSCLLPPTDKQKKCLSRDKYFTTNIGLHKHLTTHHNNSK